MIELQYYKVEVFKMPQSHEIKQIMLFPLDERIIVVALKWIYDQMNHLHQQEAYESHRVKNMFRQRYSQIDEQSMAIIKGHKINEIQKTHFHKYFKEEEKQIVQHYCDNNVRFEGYWLKVFTNYFGKEMTDTDISLAKAIIDIEANINQYRLEITVQFSDNQWILAGTIRKQFIVEKEVAVGTKENYLKWIKEGKGIFSLILNSTIGSNYFLNSYKIAVAITKEVIPFSVQHFLNRTEGKQFIQFSAEIPLNIVQVGSQLPKLQEESFLEEEEYPTKREKW